mmetsp:Transcript_19451/g.51168  ORF Transcript_19451/g.51168 Transcript_19451/m.51168 type:complete len:96 (+) Transcript_19451:1-288(+)
MEERRLTDDTTMADDTTSAASRTGSPGTVLLALLSVLLVGNVAGAVDESTTLADERRLSDTTSADDTTSPAVPRAAFWTAPVLALAAALGLAARR